MIESSIKSGRELTKNIEQWFCNLPTEKWEYPK
jgi:hypothetical protein